MNGENLNFGACGAVQGVKYPISLASQVCIDQSYPKPLQLIPPMCLVGQGALKYAKKSNLTLVNSRKMISKKARKRHMKNLGYLKSLGVSLEDERLNKIVKTEECVNVKDNLCDGKEDDAMKVCYERLDTVGAVCVDSRGHVASACSSGGLSMKHDGRIGQAATYASGVWADSLTPDTDNGIAVSTTGAGEYLVKTLLAKQLAHRMKTSQCPAHAFLQSMKEDFLESRLLTNATYKIGGAIVLCISPTGQGELLWGHTSRTMGIAYMDTSQKTVKSTFSELPSAKEGQSVTLSGVKFNLKEEKRDA